MRIAPRRWRIHVPHLQLFYSPFSTENKFNLILIQLESIHKIYVGGWEFGLTENFLEIDFQPFSEF